MNVPVSKPFAVDEDIAVRAPADFATLAPKSQAMASASDGAFGSGLPWLLTSVSITWTTTGILPGMVVQIQSAKQVTPGLATPYSLFAVDTVSSSGLSLRRLGQATGVGMPPGPSAGLTGLPFSVTTLTPQIEDASYKIYRQYGIDDLLPGRTAGELYDSREVNQLCTLTVLARQYLAMARAAGDKADDFAAKATLFAQEVTDARDAVVLHWQRLTGMGPFALEPSTSVFGMRMSR